MTISHLLSYCDYVLYNTFFLIDCQIYTKKDVKPLDNKRIRLLAAAKSVFAEKGLEKATISVIVKKAGIAQGTFYLYFSSKKALIPAIADDLLDTLLDEIQQKTQESTDIWTTLHQIISTTFKVTNSYQEVLALCYSGLAIENTLSEWEKIYTPYYSWLEDLIKRGIEQGEIRSNVDPMIAARMVIGLIESCAEQMYLFNRNDKTVALQQEQLFIFLQQALKV